MRNPFFHSKRTQSDGVVFTTRKHAALYQQGITSVALTLSSVGVMSYLLGLVLAGSPVGPAGRGELGLDGWPRLGAGIWRGWLGADGWPGWVCVSLSVTLSSTSRGVTSYILR